MIFKKQILYLILLFTFFSCKPDPIIEGPPRPNPACGIGEMFNGCMTSNDLVGLVIHNNDGALKIQTTGTNTTPVYQQTTLFTPLNHSGLSTPSILRNGSQTIGDPVKHYLSSNEIHFEVPSKYSFTIKASYIEYDLNYPSRPLTGNNSNCYIGDPSSRCKVYTKIYSMAAGTVGHDCNEFSINIPDSFTLGSCQ